MSDAEHYQDIFNYLSVAEPPTEPAGMVVFGRHDPELRLVHAVASVAQSEEIDFIVPTGGYGKDSGPAKFPEAINFSGGFMVIEPPMNFIPVYPEVYAATGEQNAKYSLDKMNEQNLSYRRVITAVAHATSLRRLSEQLRHEAIKRGTPIQKIYKVPTEHPFDAENPRDQEEACAELLRLANWPRFGWLQKQVDLPSDLVDFAKRQPGSKDWIIDYFGGKLFGALSQPMQKRMASLLQLDEGPQPIS